MQCQEFLSAYSAGWLSVLWIPPLMIPLSFPDKRSAMLGAFIARFGLGFVICNIRLPWPGWAIGLTLGLLLSVPDAIITKAMAPILASGAVGGLVIGWIAGRFGR